MCRQAHSPCVVHNHSHLSVNFPELAVFPPVDEHTYFGSVPRSNWNCINIKICDRPVSLAVTRTGGSCATHLMGYEAISSPSSSRLHRTRAE
jgi:hypothetical protein